MDNNIFLQINHSVTNTLNNFIIENNLEFYIWFFSDTPIFFLPIFFLFGWIYYEKFFLEEKNFLQNLKIFFKIKKNFSEEKKNFKSTLLLIFYSVVLGLLLNLIIQQFFFFERPESIIEPILYHIPDASFPSDHSTVSFAFLFGLLFGGYRKIFYSFGIFVILMNISRIGGGLHWFFDIIGGLIIGLLSAYTIFSNQKNKYIVKGNTFLINLAQKFRL